MIELVVIAGLSLSLGISGLIADHIIDPLCKIFGVYEHFGI